MDTEKDGETTARFTLPLMEAFVQTPSRGNICCLCVRDPHQQPPGDHPAAEAETPQHRGAERGGCWHAAGEVLHTSTVTTVVCRVT